MQWQEKRHTAHGGSFVSWLVLEKKNRTRFGRVVPEKNVGKERELKIFIRSQEYVSLLRLSWFPIFFAFTRELH